MNRSLFSLLASCISVGVLTTGCGGGGAPVTSTVPKVTINWPDSTRAVEAPKVARFAKITLKKLVTDEVLSSWVVSRPTAPSAASVTYDSPAIPTVNTDASLEVNFYGVSPSANEPILATAGTQVSIKPDGTLQLPDGSPLGSITHNLKIDQISVQVPFNLYLGESYPITVLAWNHKTRGQFIALAPDSISFEVPRGADKVTIAGNTFRGVAPGQFELKASVEKFSSTTFSVMNPEVVPVSVIKLFNAKLASNPVSGKLYATYQDVTNGNVNAFAEVDPTTGSLSHVISPFSINDLTVSKDGTKAWGISGNGIRSIDLNTFAVSGLISPTGPAGEAMTVLSLDVNPTNSNEVAVCSTYKVAGSPPWETTYAGPIIVRNGVQLANYVTGTTVQDGNRFGTYISSTQIIGNTSDPGSQPSFNPMNRFTKFDISDSGTSMVSSGNVQTTGKPHFKGGLLFTHKKIFNANTLSPTATLDEYPTFTSDESNSLVWSVSRYFQVIGIECFDATSGTSRTLKCSPTFGGDSVNSVVRISNNRLAVSFGNDVVFIVSTAPGL
jgi:hypothetical protein